MIDEISYLMGCYNYAALETGLHNFGLGFSKNRGQKLSYLERPFMQKEQVKDIDEMDDEELEYEIRKAIELEQQYMNRSKLPPTKIAELAVG